MTVHRKALTARYRFWREEFPRTVRNLRKQRKKPDQEKLKQRQIHRVQVKKQHRSRRFRKARASPRLQSV
jgi:hypothetical protein